MTQRKVEANGDYVWIIRDRKDQEHLGLAVSDGAKIRALTGVVHSVSKKGVVSEGDVIHVPPHRVEDIDFDGREYAVTKQSELFAVKRGNTFRPINRRIKVRKCVNDHIRDESGEIALYLSENGIENTNWVEIIDVADDCRKIDRKYIGYYCICPENHEKLARLLYSDDWMLSEDLVNFVTTGE